MGRRREKPETALVIGGGVAARLPSDWVPSWLSGLRTQGGCEMDRSSFQ